MNLPQLRFDALLWQHGDAASPGRPCAAGVVDLAPDDGVIKTAIDRLGESTACAPTT
jgi:hypothetical protein